MNLREIGSEILGGDLQSLLKAPLAELRWFPRRAWLRRRPRSAPTQGWGSGPDLTSSTYVIHFFGFSAKLYFVTSGRLERFTLIVVKSPDDLREYVQEVFGRVHGPEEREVEVQRGKLLPL